MYSTVDRPLALSVHLKNLLGIGKQLLGVGTLLPGGWGSSYQGGGTQLPGGWDSSYQGGGTLLPGGWGSSYHWDGTAVTRGMGQQLPGVCLELAMEEVVGKLWCNLLCGFDSAFHRFACNSPR